MDEVTFDLWGPLMDFADREWLDEVTVAEGGAHRWIAQGYALSEGDWLTTGSWLETAEDVNLFFA